MLILTRFEFYVSEICPRISSHLMLRGGGEIAYQEQWFLPILQNIPLVTSPLFLALFQTFRRISLSGSPLFSVLRF